MTDRRTPMRLSAQAPTSGAGAFDAADPHGFGAGHHHGHVIVSRFTNRLVLAALLGFTLLTIGAAKGEVWFMETFNVVFPHWVNVVVALSIATIKSTLVLLFFMQLKYDNPINSVIFCFCLFGLALFLGFTWIDLDNRGRIYAYKQGEIIKGGTAFQRGALKQSGQTPVNLPLYRFERNRLIASLAAPYFRAQLADHPMPEYEGKTDAELKAVFMDRIRTFDPGKEFLESVEDEAEELKGPLTAAWAEFIRRRDQAFYHSHFHVPHEPEVRSSGNAARPRTGTTKGLFDAKPAETKGHDSHGGH